MCLIGCKPEGRHIEQHDIFFGIAASAPELIRQMEQFWPDGGRLHLDAWRKVTRVDGFKVEVMERPDMISDNQDTISNAGSAPGSNHLYFINLGGYQPDSFEEWHHKLITVQSGKAGAIEAAKASVFYKNAAGSHVDDQYGVDIDDLYNVEDILSADLKKKYFLHFRLAGEGEEEDHWQIGYTKLTKLSQLFA